MKYLTIVMLIMLTACGGGGSSGGGGGGAVVASNPFAGTYTGTEVLTTTATNLPNSTEEYPLQVDILGNGSVTVTDVDGVVYTGQLQGSSFTASGFTDGFTLEDLPEARCTVEGSYTGSVSDGVITGTAAGTTNCELENISVSVPWEGSFSVSTASDASAPQRTKGGNSRVRSMVRAIREAS